MSATRVLQLLLFTIQNALLRALKAVVKVVHLLRHIKHCHLRPALTAVRGVVRVQRLPLNVYGSQRRGAGDTTTGRDDGRPLSCQVVLERARSR